jgi:hypothetical protein
LSSSNNPYRPPSDLPAPGIAEPESNRSVEGWPIGFAGKLEAADGQVWQDHLKSKRVLWVVKDAAFAIAVMVGLVFYWVQVTGRDLYVWPIMYFVAGLFMLQPYQSLTERWRNKQGMHALLGTLEHSKSCQGGFDTTGGSWQTEDVAVRLTWDCVHSASVGFNAVALSFWGTDWSLYLPSRFFASAADYHRLSLFLHHRFVRDAQHLPRMRHLNSIDFGKTDVGDARVVSESLDWSDSVGPFSKQAKLSDRSDTFGHEYSPAEQRSTAEQFKSIAGQCVYSAKQYLPIHLMLVCWILADRIYYGDWAFVFNRASLMFWVFYLFALGRALTDGFVSYQGHVKQQMHPVRLSVDPVGFCHAQGSFWMWIRFHERVALIETDGEIGWKVSSDQAGDPGWTYTLRRDRLSQTEILQLKRILSEATSGHQKRSQ